MENYLEIYKTFDERERSTSSKTKTLVQKTVSDLITRIKSLTLPLPKFYLSLTHFWSCSFAEGMSLLKHFSS